MKLTAQYARKYRKNGNNVFIYLVSGTADALKAYAEAQGTNHRVDEKTGKPIFFSNKSFGLSGDLTITSNGKVIFDDTKLTMAADMVERLNETSPLMAEQMAKAFAAQLLGSQPAPQPTPEPTPEPETSNDDALDKL